MLDKPAYGERWAAVWMDLARYADSQGYLHDPPRTIWRWRDWLIEALNSNLPYDQFTTEMLAGDLLPDATPSQRIATGFHRNTTNNTEWGLERRGIPARVGRRSGEHDDASVDGFDVRLRPVPQPQI